jgi:hypothetical protein
MPLRKGKILGFTGCGKRSFKVAKFTKNIPQGLKPC